MDKSPAIHLRRLTLDDVDLYYDKYDENRSHMAEHDPRLGAFFPTISDVALHLHPLKSKYLYNFAIMQNNDFAGAINLVKRRDNTAEIGYWVDRNFIGQSLATHACRVMINYANLGLGLRQLDAFIHPGNTASIKTIEKLKFQKTDELPDDLLYSLDLRAKKV
jgi:RimJ/RimL family protein N-acetyltransferase